MRCKLDKPTACYKCPYPDCMDSSCRTTWGEKLALMASRVDVTAHKNMEARKKGK